MYFISQEGFLNSGLALCKTGTSWLVHRAGRMVSASPVMHCIDSCGPLPEKL